MLARAKPGGQVFLVTEGRFSMDGDTAPLPELAEICRETGAHMIVDEAHSVGLEGVKGSGLVAACGLQEQVFASVMTYGKAPGFHGAAVLGSTSLRDYLINFCRPFIFSTGPRPGQITGLRQVYNLLDNRQTEAYQQLKDVVDVYRQSVSKVFPVTDGPIQLLAIPGNDEVMEMEDWLVSEGFLVKAIRSPSVPEGTERLRICLHAFNTPAEVKRLVRLLTEGRKKWQ